MISQDDIDAMKQYEEEKREAQLHQFAAAALAGIIETKAHGVELACMLAWKYARTMMDTKSAYLDAKQDT